MSIVTLSNRGVRSVTTFGSVNAGSMVFIKKLTASSSANLSFVNGSSDVVLDSTYKEYLFTFNNIHPASASFFQFNMSVDGGSNYNVEKTSTFFEALHNEGGSAQGLNTESGEDLAQGTGFQNIVKNFGNGNDECASGFLYLFSPSSTSQVKQFISESSGHHQSDYNLHDFCAGYGNTTSAVNAVQFKMSSGNVDSGIIKLYGIKDS